MAKNSPKESIRAPKFKKLISAPWAESPRSSYYGDPSQSSEGQHGLEHIDCDQADEEGTAKVVIRGYN